MSHPIIGTPLLTSHPLGWAVLGVAGYLTYQAGKKAGRRSVEQVERACLSDRTVKGAMKTIYKAKLKTDAVLNSTREKYGTMWKEAQAEANRQL
ncbi:hypothetical protein [Desulfobulbus propionicus]